mmetsp:Transcript_14312/g.25162  ORF Transcript_14312/g.25162 Transcript_14312/m.25162 type:complete len:209 (-) Transcript_14312:12-638(-)
MPSPVRRPKSILDDFVSLRRLPSQHRHRGSSHLDDYSFEGENAAAQSSYGFSCSTKAVRSSPMLTLLASAQDKKPKSVLDNWLFLRRHASQFDLTNDSGAEDYAGRRASFPDRRGNFHYKHSHRVHPLQARDLQQRGGAAAKETAAHVLGRQPPANLGSQASQSGRRADDFSEGSSSSRGEDYSDDWSTGRSDELSHHSSSSSSSLSR